MDKNKPDYSAQKRWRENNPNYGKEWNIKNKERISEKTKLYRKNNKDSLNKKSRNWAIANQEKVKKNGRSSHLRRKYGITIEQYEKMFHIQNGNCAICGLNQSFLKNPLGVDHNHTTGKVRGLLCMVCNLLVGYCYENLDILKNTEIYLKEYSIIGKTLDFNSIDWTKFYINLNDKFNQHGI